MGWYLMLRRGLLPLVTTFTVLVVVWQCLEFLNDLPGKDQILNALHEDSGKGTSLIFDQSGLVLGETSQIRRYPVSLNQIKQQTIQAFLTAEDRNFYHHGPLSFPDIVRAVISNALNQRREQGASTLTQQLSRNLFLSREKTFRRKIIEMALSFRLEEILSKDQILELYLNKIYLGRGAYGIEAAAKLYFGVSASGLSLAESALLASLPRAPSALAPHRNLKGAVTRRDYILGQMYSLGFIDSEALHTAIQEKPKIIPLIPRVPGYLAWVSARVKYEMKTRFANLNQRVDTLSIHTGIDLRKSEAYVRKLSRHIKELNTGRPDRGQFQLAHICLNLERMLISCLQGSVDYSRSQFNRVYQMKRQINGMMLPLLYGRLLMEEGYSLESRLSGQKSSTLWDDLYYRRFDHVFGAFEALGEQGVLGFLDDLGFEVTDRSRLIDGSGIRSSPWNMAQAMLNIFSQSGFRGGSLVSHIESKEKNMMYRFLKKEGPKHLSADASWVIRAYFRSVQKANRDTFMGPVSVSSDLQDAWYAGVRDGTLHVIWVGSEFGKSKLSDSLSKAYQWWHAVISDVFSDPLINDDQEKVLRYAGYRRMTDREGVGRIIPFRYFKN